MWNSDLPLSAVHIALAGSIVDRGFVDTAYYLFSRRHSSGKIDCPRIVYANSAIMKAASRYFHGQLSAGFSVNNEVVQEAEDYGYESDSDLEDGWGEDDEDDSSHSPSSPPIAWLSWLQGKVDETDSQAAASPVTIPGIKHTIMISDIAVNTWKALVYYIYTGKINFAPLKSQGLEYRIHEIDRFAAENPGLPPLCSPKSVYRLADKVGLELLKEKAETDIRAKLSQNMIVDELFSRFSSMYHDVLQFQVDHFCSTFSPEKMLGLQEKIKGVSKGDIPHSADALILLLQRIQSLQISPLPEPVGMEIRCVSPYSEVFPSRPASPIPMSTSGAVSHANRPGRRR